MNQNNKQPIMMKKETTLPWANAELAAEYRELMEKYEDFDFMLSHEESVFYLSISPDRHKFGLIIINIINLLFVINKITIFVGRL